MPLAHFWEPWSRLSRRLRVLAFAWPAGGDRVAASLRHTLDVLEQMRLRGRWHALLGNLLDYWYWRGVAEELGTREALASFLQNSLIHSNGSALEIELDLRPGLEAAEQQLDAERPASLDIYYGQRQVGHVAPKPGAERLRGVHLRPILATELARPMLEALALESAMDQTIDPRRLLAGFPVQAEEPLS